LKREIAECAIYPLPRRISTPRRLLPENSFEDILHRPDAHTGEALAETISVGVLAVGTQQSREDFRSLCIRRVQLLAMTSLGLTELTGTTGPVCRLPADFDARRGSMATCIHCHRSISGLLACFRSRSCQRLPSRAVPSTSNGAIKEARSKRPNIHFRASIRRAFITAARAVMGPHSMRS
jgi:hypothetical protein